MRRLNILTWHTLAQAIKSVLLLPDANVVAEITVLPLGQISWP